MLNISFCKYTTCYDMIVNVHMMKIIELLNGILSSNLIIDNELKGFSYVTSNVILFYFI